MLFSVVVFVSVTVRIIFSHRAADPIFVGPDPDLTPRIDWTRVRFSDTDPSVAVCTLEIR